MAGKPQQNTASQVQHSTVSIYDLIPSPDNYNRHPQDQIESLKASLRRFNQVDDVVVKNLGEGKYKIVAHEGVSIAMLQLLEAGECQHLEQCNITIVPEHWTEVDVRGYMMASNETARLSVVDDTALAELLQEQVNAGHDLLALGTDEESLQQMLASLGDTLIAEGGDGMEEGDEGPDVTFKEFDESIADDLDTELCAQCGKLCMKTGKGKGKK